jgi:flagellin-like hook-associated protein FlgL
MSTSPISTLSLQLIATNNLQNEQSVLAKLNEQLATGKVNSNLTDYSASDAQNMMTFQNAVTQKQAYISSMQTVQTRLSLYDQTMTDMESIATQAQSLATQNQTYDPATASRIASQAQSYLKQIGDDLNQQMGGRFIYAGSRYSTQPVVDLSTLGAPTSLTPTTAPNLPDYDSAYAPNATPPVTTNTAAFAQDSVTVDSSFSVQYGITSNATAFQQLITGLRALAAAPSNAATYKANVAAANTLLGSSLGSIETLHAGVASNQNILTNETATQTTGITSLQNQLGNIQQADLTAVSTEINLLQTQLAASYSATASLEQLSIVKYL